MPVLRLFRCHVVVDRDGHYELVLEAGRKLGEPIEALVGRQDRDLAGRGGGGGRGDCRLERNGRRKCAMVARSSVKCLEKNDHPNFIPCTL